MPPLASHHSRLLHFLLKPADFGSARLSAAEIDSIIFAALLSDHRMRALHRNISIDFSVGHLFLTH